MTEDEKEVIRLEALIIRGHKRLSKMIKLKDEIKGRIHLAKIVTVREFKVEVYLARKAGASYRELALKYNLNVGQIRPLVYTGRRIVRINKFRSDRNKSIKEMRKKVDKGEVSWKEFELLLSSKYQLISMLS